MDFLDEEFDDAFYFENYAANPPTTSDFDVEESDDELVQAQDDSIEQLLQRLELGVYSGALVCKEHSCFLDASPENDSALRGHLTRLHGSVTLTETEFALIRELAERTSRSPYFSCRTDLVPIITLPGIEVKSGFRCVTCNQADTRTARISHHPECGDRRYDQCQFQSLYRGKIKNSFGVSMVNGQLISRDDAAALEALARQLRERPADSQPDVKTQFYAGLNWFTDNTRFPLEAIAAVNAFVLPEDIKSETQEYLDRTFDSGNNAMFQDRALLRDGKGGFFRIIYDEHRRYRSAFCDFFRFLLGLKEAAFAIWLREIPLPLRAAVQGLLDARPGERSVHVLRIWELAVTEECRLDFEDVVTLFIRFRALHSLDETAHLVRISAVEGYVSYMMYFCRLYWFGELDRIPRDNNPDRDEQYRRWKGAVYAYVCDNDNTLRRLFSLKDRSQRFAAMDERLPRLIETGRHTVTCNNVVVNVNFMQSFAATIVDRFKQAVQRLLPDFNLDQYNPNLLETKAITNGASFYDGHDSNGLLGLSLLLRPDRYQQFIDGRQGQQFLWNAQRSRDFIDQYDECTRLLASMLHVTGGMPARGTETYRLTFRCVNGARNVFVAGKEFMFLSTYAKQTRATDSDIPISRFLPRIVTKYVAAYFLVYRPIYEALCEVIPDHHLNRDRDFVFLQSGTLVDPTFVPRQFRRQARSFIVGDGSLSFTDWRQIVQYFLVNMIMVQTRFIDLSTMQLRDTAFDAQFGHSALTAYHHYGRTTAERGYRGYVANDFKRASLAYHRFLNLLQPETVRNTAQEAQMQSRQLVAQVQADMPHARSFSADDERVLVGMQTLPSPIMVDDALIALRLHTQYDHFRNKEIALAATASLFTGQDVLAIVPTGSGKSLLFQLYERAKTGRELTLVVVPTVALELQIKRQFEQLGLGELVANDLQDADRKRVIVVTVTKLATPYAYQTVQRLVAHRQLKRIFVDEVHTLVYDSAFRNDMREFSRFKQLPVAFTFATATLPHKAERELKRLFYREGRPIMTVRRSCVRKSIKLSVLPEGTALSVGEMLTRALSDDGARVIVYVASIQGCVDLASQLSRWGLPVGLYHGQLTDGQKAASYDAWLVGRVRIMVATSGFGLGVDFGRIPLVVMYGLPFSFVDLVQMVGRAGRDGEPAEAVLIRNVAGAGNPSTDALVRFYADNESLCRNSIVINSMEGEIGSCFTRSVTNACDVCRRVRSRAYPLPVPHFDWTEEATDDNVMAMSVLRNLLERARPYCLLCLFLEGVCRRCRAVGGCPNGDRCLRCTRRHPVAQCPFEWPELDGRNGLNVCCWLKAWDMGVALHVGNAMDNTGLCPFKDIIKTFVMVGLIHRQQLGDREAKQEIRLMLNDRDRRLGRLRGVYASLISFLYEKLLVSDLQEMN